jgi:hypothetical protein
VNRLPGNPLIARAIEIAEKHLGIGELSKRLKVSDITIRAWRFGHEAMPTKKFLELVDILTAIDPKWNDWRGSDR